MNEYEQLSLFDFERPVEPKAAVPDPVLLPADVAEPTDRKSVVIYTDGACSGNPGPGGCAAVLQEAGGRREVSQGYVRTTNNRMEMMALLLALESMKEPSSLVIHSDSRYLINAFEKQWIAAWKRSGWRTKNRQPVKNIDLWKRLDALLAPHDYQFEWVKGHSGHPQNERCDVLAVERAKGPNRIEDAGFS